MLIAVIIYAVIVTIRLIKVTKEQQISDEYVTSFDSDNSALGTNKRKERTGVSDRDNDQTKLMLIDLKQTADKYHSIDNHVVGGLCDRSH